MHSHHGLIKCSVRYRRLETLSKRGQSPILKGTVPFLREFLIGISAVSCRAAADWYPSAGRRGHLLFSKQKARVPRRFAWISQNEWRRERARAPSGRDFL